MVSINKIKELFETSSDVILPKALQDKKFEKCALFIIPDFELNGAQTVLFEMMSEFIKIYDNIVILGHGDGDYVDKYCDLGCVVVKRSYVECDDKLRQFMQNEFSLVFINTSSCAPYLYFFLNTYTNVVWWLHETRNQLEKEMYRIPDLRLLSNNIKIIGVTHAVLEGIKQLYNRDINLLPMIIHEQDYVAANPSDKCIFLMPAAYTIIKGHDILLKAVLGLPTDVYNNCEFLFCGYEIAGQEEYYSQIDGFISKISNARNLGKLSREEVYKLYEICDCVVAPSRVDATPTTIVEAMMFKKLVLVSINTGISNYIDDGKNGFVFEDDNGLIDRITYIVRNRTSLHEVAENGYEVYKSIFSPEAVMSSLKDIIGS